MGNGVGKLSVCFTGEPLDIHRRRRGAVSAILRDPLDDSLGHSFCYPRPDSNIVSLYKVHSEESTTITSAAPTFRLSGASVSANASTLLSTSDPFACPAFAADRSSAFESSTSFAAIPLQPIPRGSISSGPLIPGSGPMERGFLSGPIERGFMSGPLDRGPLFSGPLDKSNTDDHFFRRSFSHGFKFSGSGRKTRNIIRVLQRAVSKSIPHRRLNNSIVAPLKHAVKDPDWMPAASEKQQRNSNDNLLTVSSGEAGLGLDDESFCQNMQWAQGRAGEDRVHVVVSEEHGWVFVGIYDGFNGPDAPDFLSANLYAFLHKELKGLLWDDNTSNGNSKASVAPVSETECTNGENSEMDRSGEGEQENYPCPSGEYAGLDGNLRRKRSRNSKGQDRGTGTGKNWGVNQSRWKCEWVRERIELDKRLKEQRSRAGDSGAKGCNQDHGEVLDALSRALRRTEEAYLDAADKMVMENPELALMGSCVLVMLMKGEDVYVMNVGDSRAVLAQKAEPDYGVGKIRQDLERINEETLHDLEAFDGDWLDSVPKLDAFQLSVDHSTNVEEEVQRIKSEHPDDASAILNDRVKGSLKVTRAFGAGFLKQPKWNDALLEMFRIDYIGSFPYLTCLPSLHHHRLGLKDRFLILSSDGLYQYLTNEEAVYEVGLFLTLQPEGDPAQHLVEEVLFRAAKKAGMDFHELLEIPQGDRRRYHDDISIVVISLEGTIWRSFV